MKETSKSENTKLFIEAEKLRQRIHKELHSKIRNNQRQNKEVELKAMSEEMV
tara:strand:- start:3975 stop:4130 length:156 start_codon:yes stop_codon:yes gene_type:complete